MRIAYCVWILAKPHDSHGSIKATVIDIQRWSMKDEELHVAKVLWCNQSSFASTFGFVELGCVHTRCPSTGA